MKIKKIALFLLAAVMIFTLAACGVEGPAENENDNKPGSGTVEPVQDDDEKDDTVAVKIYYANHEYIENGNEDLDHIIEVDREVKIDTKSVEEAILEELQKDPEDDNLTTLLGRLEVISVETKDNTAYLDLSSENLNGGSMEEALILQQIVYSLTDLKDVDAVQILVDGSKAETLMGHITIEEPLTRPDVE